MDLQKGFVPVVKLLVAGLLVIGALFIPIPRYQNGGCLEIDIDPPRCYSAGWKLGPSLWWQIFEGQKTVSQIVPPTPKPDILNNGLSKNLCDYEYKSSFGPVVQIKDCGDYKILEYGCCDIPSLILDRDNNEIMTCGGLKGWEKECQERFPLEASCAVTVCDSKPPKQDQNL